MPRNYKQEYDNYHSTSKAKKDRAARNKARRTALKEGRVKKGDGKDIDHKKPLRSGGSNSKGNLQVTTKSANRRKNGHSKGETQKKWF